MLLPLRTASWGNAGMLPKNWSSCYERITDSRGIF